MLQTIARSKINSILQALETKFMTSPRYPSAPSAQSAPSVYSTTSGVLASLALLALLACGTAVQAQEVGQVITRTPLYQQVTVPRQVCTQTQVTTPGQTSGAGAAMGAIAGGAIGNAMGKGEGRAIATMIGVIGGAIAGDKVEGPASAQTQTQQTCTTQQVYENRLMGYNVVYEFNGKQYTVQWPKDPGPTIKLQITPVN